MISQDSRSPVLLVSTLDELRLHEAEIVRRIIAVPNGGRLLLVDPQRLLRDINVELTSACVDESRAVHATLFAPTGREHTYDLIAKCAPGSHIQVMVNGIFAKVAR
jgi:hypothetical protein